MGNETKIQWTDSTWNPVRGCSRISPGCGGPNKEGGCYAEKMAARFSDPGMAFHGFVKRVNGEARWTGKMGLIETMLDQPLRWKRPRRIFVNSMSDLFHENLPDEAIDKVFAVMALAPQHTFQILTKRAERMREYLNQRGMPERVGVLMGEIGGPERKGWYGPVCDGKRSWVEAAIPLPNVWLGVSVEDQERAAERIPHLLATPAAMRFLSCEPLLGPVDLSMIPAIARAGWLCPLTGNHQLQPIHADHRGTRLDWVIVGGESGGRSRSFNIEWARKIVAQCNAAGVACFVKQLGARPYETPIADKNYHRPVNLDDRKGGDMTEWPPDLMIREFPTPSPTA